MTKEELAKENRELKNKVIELQNEIIKLKDELLLKQIVKETKIIEKEVIREKQDYPYFPYPYRIYVGDDGTTNIPKIPGVFYS